MKGKLKRILSVFMAFCMVFCMVFTMGIPVSADETDETLNTDTTDEIAEETDVTAYNDETVMPQDDGAVEQDEALDFSDENATYALVIADGDYAGWAAWTKAIDYENKIQFDNGIFINNFGLTKNTALVKVKEIENNNINSNNQEHEVQISLCGGNLYTELPTNGHGYFSWVTEDSKCSYVMKGTNESFTIKEYKDGAGNSIDSSKARYACVTLENNSEVTDKNILRLGFNSETKEEEATKFKLIPAKYFENEFTFEHKLTGKYIKTYEEAGKPLTVNGEANDDSTKFSKVQFGTEANRVTVSLISKSYNKGIQSGNLPNVVVHNNIGGGGWESIRVIPNGDGTISFRDSKDDKYITVKEKDGTGLLACNEPNIGTADHPLEDNEKFIIHTKLPPNPVKGLKVAEKGGSSTSIKLS